MEIAVFDGAMGTMLQERGLAPGQNPEALNLSAPEIVASVHRDYLRAGCDIVITNSFGGSRAKLKEYQMAEQLEAINAQAVAIARAVCQQEGRGQVAASMGPTGYFTQPLGEVGFAEMVDIYAQQARALASAGPDYLLLETFSDLGEMRAALLACRSVCDIPGICSMTYMKNNRTLTGVSPQAAAVTLERLGASVIGCNCSGGPAELLAVIAELAETTELPLVVQPNAGLPLVSEGVVTYPLGAEAFAQAMLPFLPYQVQFVGGCCGTTPEHIRLLKMAVQGFVPEARRLERVGTLASRERVIKTGGQTLPKIIGERINPTARKKLAQGLRDGDYALIQSEAEAQQEAGAHLLDINVGTHGIDEVQVMADLVGLLQQGMTIPLCLDSTNSAVLERALALYHGKALINSVNGERASMESILPLAGRYGAAVVALTLDEQGIPETAEGRLAIARRIVAACADEGIPPEDIYVDALTLTVGTDICGPQETLRAMRLIKEELGVQLLLGVSNVSYGLPNRPKINSAFLAMAIAAGLDLAIINPLDEQMMDSWQSAALLAGRDVGAQNYLALNQAKDDKAVPKTEAESGETTLETISRLVVKGSTGIRSAVEKLLAGGEEPLTIIIEGLVPGRNEVGRLYEEGRYYLPQLMLSAETAQKAFDLLETHMDKAQTHQKGTMVFGTVKGDIHDIGKNMVAVMVKNHGYQVIDLGKNVPAEAFLQAIAEHQAQFLGLSALMTTTMQEIPKVIALVRAQAPEVKVIVGGAVITEEFAQEAGADGYGRDAVSTVRLMEEMAIAPGREEMR